MNSRDEDTGGRRKALIACDVFRSALRYLGFDRPDGPFKITYLPAHLHLRPDHLKRQLLQTLESEGAPRPYAGCLYGQCFPNIDTVLKSRSIDRLACGHCYEILLGRSAYRELIAEQPGSFFMERTVIEDFDTLCRGPLELDDPQMREWYFEHYHQIVYIRQPQDPDLIENVGGIARFLSLDVTILEADYTDLISYLNSLFQRED